MAGALRGLKCRFGTGPGAGARRLDRYARECDGWCALLLPRVCCRGWAGRRPREIAKVLLHWHRVKRQLHEQRAKPPDTQTYGVLRETLRSALGT